MKIVVIGRNGQVARALARADASIVCLGRPDVDLERPADIAAKIGAHKPDIVINAAAYTAVDKAESDQASAFAINAIGAGAVAEAAAGCGAIVVQISTDYVFAGDKAGAYVESDPTSPRSVYGASKLEGERLVQAANPHALIVRTSWVFGATGGNFVRTMLRLARTRESINVVADQYGGPTSADDLARAILNLGSTATEVKRFGVYHAAAAGPASWADVAAATFALSKARGGPFAEVVRIPTSEYPTPAARPANSVLDCSKLQADYGIAMRPWQDTLSDCVDEIAAGGWSVG